MATKPIGEGTLYAVTNDNAGRKYLTAGKRYLVADDDGYIFTITGDNRIQIICRWNRCAHLDGGDWARIPAALGGAK